MADALRFQPALEAVEAYPCSLECCDEGWHTEEPDSKRKGWYVTGNLAFWEEHASFEFDGLLLPADEVKVRECELWVFSCGTTWVGPMEKEAVFRCTNCGRMHDDLEDVGKWGCGCG